MRDRAVIVFLSFLASALLFAGALASSTEHSFSSLTWRLIILATSGKPVRTTWIHVSLLWGAPLVLILSMICVVLGFRTARILLPVPILMAGFAYFILLKGPMDLGALLYAGGIIISSFFLLNALKGSAARLFQTPDQDEPVA